MNCKICGKRSYSEHCYLHKPHKPIKKVKKIKRISQKKLLRNNLLRKKWYKTNPPDDNGYWICYLQISNQCPIKLTKGSMQMEHVKSKVRRPDLVYTVSNIKPACSWCNAIKGSKNIKELSKSYPQLKKYLD